MGGGVGAQAPDHISLNSPKYMQYINTTGVNMNQGSMNNTRIHNYMGANENSTPSHFNRTGPIVLNNNRPSISNPVNNLQMYHPMGGPVSTKN
mmetsp:Transcript_2375/g.3610  ORF Transcript_2375/g.3610 Transcript_2375/m.3610 type:complete len:93 (+) Transcript_2375:2807-3085(+)